MSGIEFVIPINKEDLCSVGSPGQYVVDQTFSKNELPSKLREAFIAASKQGPSFVLTHFDVLYCSLVKFGELSTDTQHLAWKTISQAIQQLITDLGRYLNDVSGDSEKRHEFVTVTKMVAYLLCQLLDSFETRNLVVPGDLAKGRKTKKKTTDDECDLEAERNFTLVSLYQLIQMPIHKMWSPPVVEQDFVNLISNLCYKILENPVLSHVRMKSTRESVFQIIGTLVKRYNHGLSCTLKIIQLLQHFEHAVGACVPGLVVMIESYGCSGLVIDLVREIGNVDPRDLARDTSSSRNYAAFLTDLAEKVPSTLVSCISMLSVHLDEESHAMRNSVLSVFTEIVIQELSGEDLDAKKRDMRDQLLEPLLEHLHDVSAFVRSKVLQLWYKLCLKNAIPLSLQHKVLSLTTGRLHDKSSNVRKNAIQLLIVLIQGNPYAARLPLEELESKLKDEQTKLDQLIQVRDKEKPQPKIRIDPAKCGPSKEELWMAMEPEILTTITEVMDEETMEESTSDQDMIERIVAALNGANYKKAIRLMVAHESEEDSDEEDEEAAAEKLLNRLKEVFIGDEVVDREALEKMVRESVEEEHALQEKVNQTEEDSKEISQQKMLVLYLSDSVAFARCVHDSIPLVCQMLCSKQVSDILEAIQFFVTAYEFDVLDAMVGVRRMLSLVWSSESDVKQAVVNAYKRLYMTMDGNSKKHSVQVVSNLTGLITCSTQGELASLEELVSLCVETGDLPKSCIQVMWERFSMNLPETSEDESRAALQLLAMVATAQVQVVSSNVNVLVSVGLGERGLNDFRLAHLACTALLKLAPQRSSTDDRVPPMRFPPTHDMFQRTVQLLVDGLMRLEDVHYSQFAVSAVSLIYLLAEHPDCIMGDVLKKMCTIVYTNSQLERTDSAEDGELQVPSQILTRMLVIAGQVAVRQLVHLDTHVYAELRRRSRVREEQENSSKQKGSSAASGRRPSAATGRPSSEDAVDDDDLVGAVADDEELEMVKRICETEIVTGGRSLLSLLAPLVVSINSNPVKYADPALRAAASLCLAEFMLISASFCAQHLQLLFTVLDRSPEEVIRSNLVIAIGDFNSRFPNLIEPWTPHLYGRLRDTSAFVKRTTLNVLSHLILSDRVKVKGQISDIALCIIDDDQRIAGMARMFFSEFARKSNNHLYNVMPDIISRLCDPSAELDEQNFHTILKWIMALIQKEKQCESLVEKIILRLGASRTERQSRDLMFCLSLLSFNERSLRRVIEHWSCISDKLHETVVSETLTTILANTKKMAKQEIRTLVEEIEAKIQETMETEGDAQDVVRKAQCAVAPTSKNMPSGVKSKGRKQRQRAKSSSASEAESVDDEGDQGKFVHPAHAPPLSERRAPRKSRKATVKSNSSDDENEDHEEAELKLRRPANRPAKGGSTRCIVAQPSNSEEDQEEMPDKPKRNRGYQATSVASKSSDKRKGTRSRR